MSEWLPAHVAPAPTTPPPRKPSAWRRHVAALGRTALDLVYPPTCLACRAAVLEPGALCPTCWGQVRFIERPFCERLGTPFPHDLGEGLLSPEAMADPPVWNRARAVAAYDDGPARALTQRLKYYDRLDVAEPMGRWMARAGAELIADADLLVPTPLHRMRLAARRSNQAMALARVVCRESGVPVDAGALERIRATAPQVGLSKAQRALNMRGAFRVPEEARGRIAERRIILIDDVLTSGATTNAAARALLRAGAANVDVLVFARVVLSG